MVLKGKEPNMNRVAITGLGVVAPNGIGVPEFWQNCCAGVSGISKIESFDTSEYPVKIAGEVRGFDPAAYLPRKIIDRTDRFVHLGGAAAAMALKDANLSDSQEWRDEAAVIIGSSLGGQLFHEESVARALRDGLNAMGPNSVPAVMPSSVSAYIAIINGLRGPNLCISTACSSGANAIGEAFRRIRSGDSEVVLTGGVEAPITPFCFYAHCALKVLSTASGPPEGVSNPFDVERCGFVMGEGGAMLVLEGLERARARGAHIYAEIVGFGSNSGAYHIAIPDPSAKDLVRVMSSALKVARLEPEQIDYVNAHGTATKANDQVEVLGLEKVFESHMDRLLISSTKSMLGHLLGAAGAVEAAICALSLRDQVAPPTINLKQPEFRYDFVPNRARKAKLNYAMSNSFGFGSNNSCLIFRRYDES
jgi:3-oxoacyl-[acyl-carrier-protein] synthase II